MKNMITVFTLFAIPIGLSAQYFQLGTNSVPDAATSINSMDVASADFDGDGHPDIVIAAEFNRNLLLFNDGEGGFSEDPDRFLPKKVPLSPLSGQDSEEIGIADFDNDGDLDILFISEDTQFHELLINDGEANFTFPEYEFPSSLGNALAMMDLNNDGFTDIVVGNSGQNQVFINNQDLSFMEEPSRWPENDEWTQDMKVVDLDDDGDLDIIEGTDQGTSNILINEDGFFVEENNRLTLPEVGLEVRKVVVGDVNGDTFPDLLFCTVNFTGLSSLQNRLFLNDGEGFFTDVTQEWLPIYDEQTLDGVFVDFDNDQDLDLITSGFASPGNNVRAFINSDGFFSQANDEVLPEFTVSDGISIHSANLNGDELTDLYIGGFGESDVVLFGTMNQLDTKTGNMKETISVFPNPCRDKLNLSLANRRVCKNATVRILDTLGRMALEFEEEFISGEQMIDLNLGSGSYTLELSCKSFSPVSVSFMVE